MCMCIYIQPPHSLSFSHRPNSSNDSPENTGIQNPNKMGGIFISPVPAFRSSICLQRRRCSRSETASSNHFQPYQRERRSSTSTLASDAQYANAHQTALLAVSGVLTILALVLSALLPVDQTVFTKIGLWIVPVYTLSLHLRTTTLFCTPPWFTARGRINPLPLSVAWFTNATLAALIWLYDRFMATTATSEGTEGTLVYTALVVCALLECGLIRRWGEGLFLASLPRVRMTVDGAVIDAEKNLEEGTTKIFRVGEHGAGSPADTKVCIGFF